MPSTAIQRFSYDTETRTLFITFVDGDLYAYKDVGPEAYHALRAALSKGRFFARQIRGRYAYAKLGIGGEDERIVFTPPSGPDPTARR